MFRRRYESLRDHGPAHAAALHGGAPAEGIAHRRAEMTVTLAGHGVNDRWFLRPGCPVPGFSGCRSTGQKPNLLPSRVLLAGGRVTAYCPPS
jgi:hypothetical protein